MIGPMRRDVEDSRLRRAVAGRVVLITGASSGIGAASARRLGAAGATVLLVARREALLDDVRDDIVTGGGRAVVYACDLSDEAAVDDLARRALEEHGHVDVLVNNAGLSINRWISESYDRFHDFTRTIDVNYLGPVKLTMALLEPMRERGTGHIVTVSTAGTYVGAPGWTAYLASKTAFDTWLRGVAPEAAADGVAVTTIHMTLVRTPMVGSFGLFEHLRGMTADEAARSVCRAIVERPRTIAPLWWRPAISLQLLLDTPGQRLLARYARRVKRPRARRSRTRTLRGIAAARRAGKSPLALLALQAERVPDRTAIIDDRRSVTFRDLDRRVRRLAAALSDRYGVGPDRGIAILCRNHAGFAEALLAALRLGAPVTFLNTDFGASQLRDVLSRSGADLLIHDPDLGAADAARQTDVVLVPSSTLDELVEGATSPAPTVRARSSITLLTSGTTGTPKGASRQLGSLPVVHDLRKAGGRHVGHAVRRTMQLARHVPRPRPGQGVVTCVPLHHGYGLGGLFLGLATGSPVVLRKRFDARTVLEDVGRHDGGTLLAVPTMLQRIVDLPTDTKAAYDVSSLRLVISGGAALSPALSTAVMDLFGEVLVNGYGATEIGAVAFALPSELRAAPGTVGPPAPTARVRILDARGTEVPTGVTGEIHVHKPFDGQEAGFVGTGDLGHRDEAGRLFVDGRVDDMIVSGGENVYPQEVEDLLHAHPAVADAAVYGVPDPEYGQRLAAVIVLREGLVVGPDDIRQLVRDNLSRAKVPRDVTFADALPRTSTGKLQRRHLR